MKRSYSTNTTSMAARSPMRLAVIALGATSMGAQIIVLREGLALAYGNELVVGVLLGSWLTLTGLGAYAGRWTFPATRSTSSTLPILILAAILPIITVVAAILLRVSLFPPGTMLDLPAILTGCLILLSPFCIISGIGFVIFSSLSRRERWANSGSEIVGRVYGWEAVGSFVGGLCVSVLMILLVSSIDALLMLLLADLCICLMIASRARSRPWMVTIGLLILCFAAGRGFLDLDWIVREQLFRGQDLLEYHNTPFGALAVTSQGEQHNIFQNGVLVGSSDDVVSREEAVHYALAQRPEARTVLMISGGASGTLHELMKYPATRTDYLEIDPAMVNVVRQHAGGIPPLGVDITSQDAILFLQRIQKRYDVVLLVLSDPSTIQNNRYFTVEFFRRVKEKLSREGVVSWSISSSADYLGEEARQVRSVLFATGKAVFKNVLLVPGERDYFLASDGPLDIRIGHAIEAAHIPTVYVNRSYIDDSRLEERSNDMLQTIDVDAPLNTDFSPVSTLWQLRFWLRYFESPAVLPLALLLACFLAITIRPNVLSVGVFAIGMGGMTLEVILLLGFQIICGYLYQMTGVLLTVFMGGLAVGAHAALWRGRKPGYVSLAFAQGAIAVVAFVIPSVLCWIRSSTLATPIVYLLFLTVMFSVSLLSGAAFAIGAALKVGDLTAAASELYGSDLSGSAFAAFLVSALLIPWIGFRGASWVVGAVVLVASAMSSMKGRSRQAMSGAR
jgi:spermidine synthase